MKTTNSAAYPLIKEFNSLQKKITIVKVSDKLYIVNIHKKFLGLPFFSVSREFRTESEAQKFFTQTMGNKHY